MVYSCAYSSAARAWGEGGAPDEDPVPQKGNPDPMRDIQHFHPNQNNHLVGPILYIAPPENDDLHEDDEQEWDH